MRILDRYILTSIIRVFVMTILIFVLLYILIDTTTNLDDLIERQVPVRLWFVYYLNFIPIIFIQTSSTACLVATLLSFSHMNTTNEIIVMRSSGMTFWQLTKPALYFGLIISVLAFWVNERVVPASYALTKKIKEERLISKKKADWQMRERINNITLYGLKNRLYFIEHYDPSTEEISGITIIEFGADQSISQKIVALKGHWTGIAWKFFNCQISTYEPAANRVPVKFYKEKLMDIKETPQDLMKQRLNVTSMNYRQLADYITRFSSSGATRAITNLRVDLHSKVAIPFASFVITLIGLPFALLLRNRKRSSFAAIGIAMLIGFLYYVLNAVCLAFGKGAFFPPIIAAWSAPVITTLFALIIIEKNF